MHFEVISKIEKKESQLRHKGQDHGASPERLCIMLLLPRQRGTLFHFTSIFREPMNCYSRWSVTRDRGQTVKDILIFLSCQVDAPSCSGRHFSSFFQSPQHSVGGSSDCHKSSWNIIIDRINVIKNNHESKSCQHRLFS